MRMLSHYSLWYQHSPMLVTFESLFTIVPSSFLLGRTLLLSILPLLQQSSSPSYHSQYRPFHHNMHYPACHLDTIQASTASAMLHYFIQELRSNTPITLPCLIHHFLLLVIHCIISLRSITPRPTLPLSSMTLSPP